jgi:hypothetical protein
MGRQQAPLYVNFTGTRFSDGRAFMPPPIREVQDR